MNDGSKIAAALFAVKSVSLIPTGNPEMVQKRVAETITLNTGGQAPGGVLPAGFLAHYPVGQHLHQ